MADIRIQDIDEEIVFELKARAKRLGCTLREVLRAVLTDEVRRPRRDLGDRLDELRGAIRAESGEMPDSIEYLRQQRDVRG